MLPLLLWPLFSPRPHPPLARRTGCCKNVAAAVAIDGRTAVATVVGLSLFRSQCPHADVAAACTGDASSSICVPELLLAQSGT